MPTTKRVFMVWSVNKDKQGADAPRSPRDRVLFYRQRPILRDDRSPDSPATPMPVTTPDPLTATPPPASARVPAGRLAAVGLVVFVANAGLLVLQLLAG